MTSSTRLPVVQPDSADRLPAAPPVFERIAIVGLGLIGGSIALGVRQVWPKSLVIGVDDRAVLEKAMVLHAIDVGADDLVVIKEADLVVLAAPVGQNLELLTRLDDHVPGAAVVTDTGSTKRVIVGAAASLPSRLAFVGGHPLGGAARSGIEFARADLFRDRPWLFTPGPETAPETMDRLFRFAGGLGAKPQALDAAAHDRLLAYLSHLPQLASSALMHVVGEEAGEAGLALAGRGLQDTTRLAASPAGIWRDIARTNADQLDEALDRMISALTEVRRDLRAGDALDRLFASASGWKARMP